MFVLDSGLNSNQVRDLTRKRSKSFSAEIPKSDSNDGDDQDETKEDSPRKKGSSKTRSKTRKSGKVLRSSQVELKNRME